MDSFLKIRNGIYTLEDTFVAHLIFFSKNTIPSSVTSQPTLPSVGHTKIHSKIPSHHRNPISQRLHSLPTARALLHLSHSSLKIYFHHPSFSNPRTNSCSSENPIQKYQVVHNMPARQNAEPTRAHPQSHR